MTAVLVDSRKNGETGWIATRGLERVRVQGLGAGSNVLIALWNHEHVLSIVEDGEYDLLYAPDMIKVSHAAAGKDCRVFVDLI